ncbi:MAG TPA: hypothetical protein VEQ18_05365 [Candidatus Nitrosocosmicus sp.]|nr:hypothetical protein [Candidatus Nitrosocosmicus sp.]
MEIVKLMEMEKKENQKSKSTNTKCRFCNCRSYNKPSCGVKEMNCKLEIEKKAGSQIGLSNNLTENTEWVGEPTGKETITGAKLE